MCPWLVVALRGTDQLRPAPPSPVRRVVEEFAADRAHGQRRFRHALPVEFVPHSRRVASARVRIAQPMMSERFLVVFFLVSSTRCRCFTMFPGLLPTNAVVPIGNALLVYDPDQIHNYLAGAQLCKN